MGKNKSRKRKGHSKIVVGLIISIILFLSLTVAFVFKVENIEYVGSQHYDKEALMKNIFNGKRPNALLYFLYEKNNPRTIPFIQKYDAEIIWPNKMIVTVYEKPIIGYVNYMGCDMYFDKDGVIVESSTKTLSGVPQVTGLSFKSIVLNSKLEVSNPSVFSEVLELTQSFDKYEIIVDKIYFDSNNEVTLYMSQIKVLLGNGDKLVDKLNELKQIMPGLEGRKGTLHLENYTPDASGFIFKEEN
ncbi:cell division protein FtsQ/DivIB [[Clostridium] fimetarium]|uniref:Cell division protein FtsQ n=1 Tax=[Clostridium] fimetarium TaxID=99656 RepID=A0A1I0MTL7_9FIRM|nr:cell division protein FtsQ/DivIB [[Clostridium] fimetarium]SEV91804.1 cell division protein FtsQ [[Clostridium] fimetarium]